MSPRSACSGLSSLASTISPFIPVLFVSQEDGAEEIFHLRHGDILRLGPNASFRVHVHGGAGYCTTCRNAWSSNATAPAGRPAVPTPPASGSTLLPLPIHAWLWMWALAMYPCSMLNSLLFFSRSCPLSLFQSYFLASGCTLLTLTVGAMTS